MHTLCDECVPNICVNVKTYSVNSISIISRVFSSSSGVFAKTRLTAIPRRFSLMCVWPGLSLVSVIYVSQVHTGILGKLSEDTEISNIMSVCYASEVFSQVSVSQGFQGKALPCCSCTVHPS